MQPSSVCQWEAGFACGQLLLSGENDHFIPIKMHNKQIKALVNAETISDRIFTKKESAQNHCQIGNIALLLDVIINWLKEL